MTTLVLLPGLDGTGALFAPFVAALRTNMPVRVMRYAPDPRLNYAALLAELEHELADAGPLVLLGESFSGPLAIALAAARPDQVRGLLLCCSFAHRPRASLALLRWLPPLRPPVGLMRRLLLGSAPDTDGALRSVLTSLPMTLVRARLQAIAGVDVRPELSRQRCPVLAMQAQHDRLVPASAGAEMQAILPSLRLVTLPGPHGLLQACPREAAGVVEEFLETALAARPHST